MINEVPEALIVVGALGLPLFFASRRRERHQPLGDGAQRGVVCSGIEIAHDYHLLPAERVEEAA